MKALQTVYPDISEEEAPPRGVGRLNYPRPISEPPSPISTRAHSPVSSLADEVDTRKGHKHYAGEGGAEGLCPPLNRISFLLTFYHFNHDTYITCI